jgi:DNA-directed RNA polymerase subunit RPC12/RpoP
MKIIKGPDPWSTQLTCPDKDCGTVVEISSEDVKYGLFGGAYCEEGEAEWYVECPSCGEAIFIKKLPKVIKALAREKYNDARWK